MEKKEEATTTQEWTTDWVWTTEEATKTNPEWKDYESHSHNDDGKERKESQNWQRLELLRDTSASAVSTTTWESTSAVYTTSWEQVSDTTTWETQGVTETSMEAPKWTRWETKTPGAKQTEAPFPSLDEGSESKSSALLVNVACLIALL